MVFDVGEIFADQIVAPDRVVGPENARHRGTAQPRLIGFAPDVMVGVDDVEVGHQLSVGKLTSVTSPVMGLGGR